MVHTTYMLFKGGGLCLHRHTVQEADEMVEIANSLKQDMIDAAEGAEKSALEESLVQPNPTNVYMTGDKVSHNSVAYESLVDNNLAQLAPKLCGK